MRLAQDQLAKIKNYVHAAQGGIIAIAWLLCIIIFTRDGNSDGRLGWYFGLVSIHIGTKSNATNSVVFSVLAVCSDPSIPCHGPHVVESTALF